MTQKTRRKPKPLTESQRERRARAAKRDAVPQIPDGAHQRFTAGYEEPPPELRAECDAAIRQAMDELRARHIEQLRGRSDHAGGQRMAGPVGAGKRQWTITDYVAADGDLSHEEEP